MSRRWRVRAIFLGVAIALVAAVPLAARRIGGTERVSFDVARWRTTDAMRSDARVAMLADLVGTRLRPGMRPWRVRVLLGEPDDRSPGEWRYYAGTRFGGLLRDDVYLELRFAHRRLLRADVYADS